MIKDLIISRLTAKSKGAVTMTDKKYRGKNVLIVDSNCYVLSLIFSPINM